MARHYGPPVSYGSCCSFSSTYTTTTTTNESSPAKSRGRGVKRGRL